MLFRSELRPVVLPAVVLATVVFQTADAVPQVPIAVDAMVVKPSLLLAPTVDAMADRR